MQTEQEKNWESDSLIFSTTLLVKGLCFCDEYDKKKSMYMDLFILL